MSFEQQRIRGIAILQEDLPILGVSYQKNISGNEWQEKVSENTLQPSLDLNFSRNFSTILKCRWR